MINWLKDIKPSVITSVGGILLAGLLAFILYKTISNEIPHLETAIRETSQIQATVQQQTNEVLRDNAKAIEGNTKVLEIIERRIR